MVGLLLSDGYKSYSARSKNGYLSLTQSLSNPYYVYFVYNILSHYCTRYHFIILYWFYKRCCYVN